MPTASLPSPPDIQAILTSLGVFSLAIAAVVGGIYKGIKEVRKNHGADLEVISAADGWSTRSLTDSIVRLTDANRDLHDAVRQIDHRASLLIESLADHKAITRSQLEDQHRLRASIGDLVDVIRRRL